MSGHRDRIDVLFLPTTAKTVSQEEIDALEAKRIRRLRELGDWRPSSGFHIEPTLPPEITAPPPAIADPIAPQVMTSQPQLRAESTLRPDGELSVLEGRDVAPSEEQVQQPAAPRRIRVRRATRSGNDIVWLAMSGVRQSLHRG